MAHNNISVPVCVFTVCRAGIILHETEPDRTGGDCNGHQDVKLSKIILIFRYIFCFPKNALVFVDQICC